MTSVVLDESVGLRERKRRATSRTIQFTVLELAAERGLEQVTVDEISRVANISPRTFFNYFPSKESAMVGENPLAVQSELIESFVDDDSDRDIFDGLLELMQHMAMLGTADRELHQLRRQVLRDYPELFVLKISGMRGFESALAEAIERRLIARGATTAPADAGGPLEARARLTALVAMAAMRHAFTLWADGEDEESLAEKLVESFALLRHVL
ncbi:TetR family transcriptional regulator [Agreia sp. VKM Ac-1783]|uniref:TetR family transcriptional regulator n=1 Tax=Agreia sp. VKM Ac-1783 TaxID=1938889 RepID=UPI000A2AC7B8|nr:TetR family transcriptional regulator [Agreia sp. VKM Ac-1783]SMQ60020.1 transcriptional regulator, TetR family [Agreia sp. VKM Ac-1783]